MFCPMRTVLSNATFSGYGVFIVAGKIDIKHNMTMLDDAVETTLGLYADQSITFKADNLAVWVQSFTNGMIKPKGHSTIYGNITAGNKVEFPDQDEAGNPLGPTIIHYRPASPALTAPFWPMHP